VVSAFGHDEGDAIGTTHLLEGLVEVPLGTTTPMLGEKSLVLLADGGGATASLPFLEAPSWELHWWRSIFDLLRWS
jgi:hypothetical protein